MADLSRRLRYEAELTSRHGQADRIQRMADEVDALEAERVRLRALLAQAIDHIDPNDDQAALDLLRESEEAVR